MHSFDTIQAFSEPVTLFGGGFADPALVTECLRRAPVAIAADGGARTALSLGIVPQAVVGDFDSISAEDKAAIPPERLFEISEQDSTDFDKALRVISAPLILAVGFLGGGRADHELAAFNTLVRSQARLLLVGSHDVAFHLKGGRDYRFECGAGLRVSLFPFHPVSGESEGLHWPIRGLDFTPGGRVGTSNHATGPVRIRMDGDGMIALLPRSALDIAIRATA